MGQEIGKIDKLLFKDGGEPKYVAVKTALIPVECILVDGGQRALVLQ